MKRLNKIYKKMNKKAAATSEEIVLKLKDKILEEFPGALKFISKEDGYGEGSFGASFVFKLVDKSSFFDFFDISSDNRSLEISDEFKKFCRDYVESYPDVLDQDPNNGYCELENSKLEFNVTLWE
jgi:hypothetical protein